MAGGFCVVAHQVSGADLIPSRLLYLPPWQIAEGGVGAEGGPAGAEGAPAVGTVAGGEVRGGVGGAGGVGVPETLEHSPHGFFRGGRGGGLGRCRCSHLLGVGGIGVDVDAVVGGVIFHAEVHRFPNVPELDEVVAMDGVCLELDPLAVHVEGLAGGRGGEGYVRRLGRAAQGKAGENTHSHKNHFSFSAHNLFSLRFLWCFGKQHNTKELGRSLLYSKQTMEKKRVQNEANYTVQASRATTHQR